MRVGLVEVERGRQQVLPAVEVGVVLDHLVVELTDPITMLLVTTKTDQSATAPGEVGVELQHDVPHHARVLADLRVDGLARLLVDALPAGVLQPAVQLLQDLPAVRQLDLLAVAPHPRHVQVRALRDDPLVRVLRLHPVVPVHIPELVPDQTGHIRSRHTTLTVAHGVRHCPVSLFQTGGPLPLPTLPATLPICARGMVVL